MRSFGRLIHKELRDARVTLCVLGLLTAVAPWVVNPLLSDYALREVPARYGVTSLWALFALALAADSVSGDAGSGRGRWLASLPLSPSRHFAAKVVFLFTTWLFGLAWIVAWQCVQLAKAEEGVLVARFGECLGDLGPVLGLIGCAALATVLASTWGLGGIAAALAGALLTSVPCAFVVLVTDAIEFAVEDSLLWGGVVVLALLFLAAVWMSFVPGRGAIGSRVMSVTSGVAVLAGVALPCAAVSGAAYHRWSSLEPGNAMLSIQGLVGSPDGRMLAVEVRHRLARGLCGIWVIDLESGSIRLRTDRYREPSHWVSDGEFVVVDEERVGWVLEAEGQETARLARTEDLYEIDGKWWSWKAVERREMFPDAERVRPQYGHPGIVLFQSAEGHLIWHDTETGIDREFPGSESWLVFDHRALSADGAHLIVWNSGEGQVGPQIVDASDGEVVAGPWPQAYAQWGASARASQALVLHGGDSSQGCRWVDPATGAEVDLPMAWPKRGWRGNRNLTTLADGSLVRVPDDGRILHLPVEGGTPRLIYDPSQPR